VISLASAEVARPLRYLLVPLGAALLVTPFLFDADIRQIVASVLAGLALMVLSIRRGPIRGRYGAWQGWVI
jgi:VIT1/CCC1 family predicted Fe2+/Mn2+ transporter